MTEDTKKIIVAVTLATGAAAVLLSLGHAIDEAASKQQHSEITTGLIEMRKLDKIVCVETPPSHPFGGGLDEMSLREWLDRGSPGTVTECELKHR